MTEVTEILKLVALLLELVKDVIAVASSENPSRVQDVLPPTLETSIAKLRVDLEAAKKFGPRP